MKMDIVVTVEEGKIRGKKAVGLNGTTFYSFQGIPYAKPPLGDLRFRAPRPHKKWSGIKDCTQEGPSSYSRHMIYNNVIGSEDCLILNVFTKDSPKIAASNPVMVWIYGGGFLIGSSNDYGPDFFMTKDVVLVTINYRVGALGFLSFDDPDLGVPGNAGLKDQVMALKWVQKNIKNFGGDPGNVTIFGNSAGACSAHYLMLSPMAKGLFHKAILQSGSALCPWSIANSCLKNILTNLLCPYTNEKDILRFLQEQPVDKLFEAQDQLGDHMLLHIRRDFGPIIEKPSTIEPNFITEHPIDILKNGMYNKVPIILGYTSKESLLLHCYQTNYKTTKLTVADFEEAIPYNFNIKFGTYQSKKIGGKIKEFYFNNEESTEFNAENFILMHSDLYFMFGTQLSAELHLKTSSEPIYLYKFSVEGGRNLLRIALDIQSPGACHADEIAYLFHMDFSQLLNGKITPNSLEDKTIHAMIGFWTNFARTGNPNSNDTDIIWKPIAKDAFNFVDIGNSLSVGTSPDEDRMKFCKEIYNFTTKSI